MPDAGKVYDVEILSICRVVEDNYHVQQEPELKLRVTSNEREHTGVSASVDRARKRQVSKSSYALGVESRNAAPADTSRLEHQGWAILHSSRLFNISAFSCLLVINKKLFELLSVDPLADIKTA